MPDRVCEHFEVDREMTSPVTVGSSSETTFDLKYLGCLNTLN